MKRLQYIRWYHKWCMTKCLTTPWYTHQSIYKNLGTLLTLMERVNICQLLQQVHHSYGNMFFKLRVNKHQSMLRGYRTLGQYMNICKTNVANHLLSLLKKAFCKINNTFDLVWPVYHITLNQQSTHTYGLYKVREIQFWFNSWQKQYFKWKDISVFVTEKTKQWLDSMKLHQQMVEFRNCGNYMHFLNNVI